MLYGGGCFSTSGKRTKELAFQCHIFGYCLSFIIFHYYPKGIIFVAQTDLQMKHIDLTVIFKQMYFAFSF